MCFPAAGLKYKNHAMRILRAVKSYDFLCMVPAIFENLSFIIEKFFYSDERTCFPAAKSEH